MSDNRIIECMERAQYLLGNLMAVKPGEEVLIVVVLCFIAVYLVFPFLMRYGKTK